MIDHALDYARRGFRVLPLNGKVPRNLNGCHGATTDPDALRRWWGMWPDADVGIATGDGLAVLDVDPRHGGDDSLNRLEDEHGEIRTYTVRTGGGGLHFYLSTDGDMATAPGFLPGLDLKARGGYVVAPPSLHASGNRYEWIAPADLPTEPQPAPAWLVELVSPPRSIRSPAIGFPAGGECRINPTTSARYVATAIEQEARAVAGATEGERNSQLNKSAYALARFVAAGEADGPAVMDLLHQSARHAGLSQREINRTLHSAFKARRAA